MRPRYALLALALVLAGCGSVLGPGVQPSPTPPASDAYVAGPMSPSCPSQSGGGKQYPPTERRTFTVEETWTQPAEARRLAENHTGLGGNLTAPDGRFDAIGWTGDYIDVEDRWNPDRYRVFEAADGSDYAVLVLGYHNWTVLETFYVAGYC
jgi:hypothetical protein